MRVHRGALLAGAVYLALGITFVLEALEVWTMQIGDLRLVAPLALVVIGIAILIGATGGPEREQRS